MPRALPYLALCTMAVTATAEDLTPQRQSQLRELVHQDCGSCHGMRLTGGLGPALTPEALTGKNQEFLFLTISEGRSGTPMPPWKNFLSKADINWIVDYLKYSGVEP